MINFLDSERAIVVVVTLGYSDWRFQRTSSNVRCAAKSEMNKSTRSCKYEATGLTTTKNDVKRCLKKLSLSLLDKMEISRQLSEEHNEIKLKDMEIEALHKKFASILKEIVILRKTLSTKYMEIECLSQKFDLLNKSFEGLLESDFTIKLHEKEYKVHKFILSVRGKGFQEMFTDGGQKMKSFNKLVMSRQAFEDFLSFLYTGETKGGSNVKDLFTLTHFFKVEDLQLLSVEIIRKILKNENNVREAFSMGHLYSLEKMKEVAFKLLVQKHTEIIDWMISEPDLVSTILEKKDRVYISCNS